MRGPWTIYVSSPMMQWPLICCIDIRLLRCTSCSSCRQTDLEQVHSRINNNLIAGRFGLVVLCQLRTKLRYSNSVTGIQYLILLILLRICSRSVCLYQQRSNEPLRHYAADGPPQPQTSDPSFVAVVVGSLHTPSTPAWLLVSLIVVYPSCCHCQAAGASAPCLILLILVFASFYLCHCQAVGVLHCIALRNHRQLIFLYQTTWPAPPSCYGYPCTPW